MSKHCLDCRGFHRLNGEEIPCPGYEDDTKELLIAEQTVKGYAALLKQTQSDLATLHEEKRQILKRIEDIERKQILVTSERDYYKQIGEIHRVAASKEIGEVPLGMLELGIMPVHLAKDQFADADRWRFFAASPQTALMLGSTRDPNDKTVDWLSESNMLVDKMRIQQ